MADIGKGTLGEKLIANFFDTHSSRLFSFPNPKTNSNAEVADVLVWWNHAVLLVEVKTRAGWYSTIAPTPFPARLCPRLEDFSLAGILANHP
jgi:hypothetical protein